MGVAHSSCYKLFVSWGPQTSFLRKVAPGRLLTKFIFVTSLGCILTMFHFIPEVEKIEGTNWGEKTVKICLLPFQYPYFFWKGCPKMFWTVLGYTVAKECTSPRNLIWFTRPRAQDHFSSWEGGIWGRDYSGAWISSSWFVSYSKYSGKVKGWEFTS